MFLFPAEKICQPGCGLTSSAHTVSPVGVLIKHMVHSQALFKLADLHFEFWSRFWSFQRYQTHQAELLWNVGSVIPKASLVFSFGGHVCIGLQGFDVSLTFLWYSVHTQSVFRTLKGVFLIQNQKPVKHIQTLASLFAAGSTAQHGDFLAPGGHGQSHICPFRSWQPQTCGRTALVPLVLRLSALSAVTEWDKWWQRHDLACSKQRGMIWEEISTAWNKMSLF